MLEMIKRFAVVLSIPLLAAADTIFAFNPFFHAHTDALDRIFSSFHWYRRLTYCDWRRGQTGWTRVRPGDEAGSIEHWGYQPTRKV